MEKLNKSACSSRKVLQGDSQSSSKKGGWQKFTS